MIPRYQRILFVVLLGSSVLMALYLLRLHHEHRRQLAALSDATPLSAPDTADAEDITLALANDADGSITPTVESIALPVEPGARARALLERLLAGYALPNSRHPLAGGPSVDDVFLLPVDAPKPKDPNASAYASEPSENTSLLAVINLHGAFVQGHPSGILPEMLTIRSILGTLHLNLPRIAQVRFLVDGQQAQTLAGHADLTRIYPVVDTSTRPLNTDSSQPDSDTP
ncbi:MAG TPA: GerMN domain-containing protein [Acidobacteriaceae bacterium]|nr:GerMN domain-containing protein [Acidobacteriaceae bacterium]